MKLTISGNLNTYYAQTLCLLFFPGAKFSEHETVTAETPQVHMEVVETDEHVAATVTITIGEQRTSGTHSYTYRRRAEVVEELKKSAAVIRVRVIK